MAAAAAAVIPINSDPGGILVPGMRTWHTIDSTPYLVHMMVARYVMTHLTTRVFFVQLPCKKVDNKNKLKNRRITASGIF